MTALLTWMQPRCGATSRSSKRQPSESMPSRSSRSHSDATPSSTFYILQLYKSLVHSSHNTASTCLVTAASGAQC